MPSWKHWVRENFSDYAGDEFFSGQLSISESGLSELYEYVVGKSRVQGYFEEVVREGPCGGSIEEGYNFERVAY